MCYYVCCPLRISSFELFTIFQFSVRSLIFTPISLLFTLSSLANKSLCGTACAMCEWRWEGRVEWGLMANVVAFLASCAKLSISTI